MSPFVLRAPHLGVGETMFGWLRVIRGLCGLLFGLNVMGLYTMNTVPLFLINAVSMVMFATLFLWLRRVINRVYAKRHGVPHPALAKRWAL